VSKGGGERPSERRLVVILERPRRLGDVDGVPVHRADDPPSLGD
jgi:hypothetical protein